MSYQFLHPAMAIAALGLLVPLLIHLWNRQRGRIVRFGSTQFLEAQQRKKISRLSFSQPLLFLLRATMVALAVLLLLEPVHIQNFQVSTSPNPNWLLVSPSLSVRNDWQSAIDTQQYRNYEKRILTTNFPLWNENTSNNNADKRLHNTWSILQAIALHKQAPDSVAIYFTPNSLQFQGKKPSISTHITWYEIPHIDQQYFILEAWENDDSTLSIIIGMSSEAETTFERYTVQKNSDIRLKNLPLITYDTSTNTIYFTEKKERTTVKSKPNLAVRLYYDASFRQDRNYINAALKAIAKTTDIPIDIRKERITNAIFDEKINGEATIFWLSEKALPADWLNDEQQTIFTYKKDELGGENFIKTTWEAGRTLHLITQRLADGEASTRLPHQLLEKLLTPTDLDVKLAQYDQRKIVPSQYKARTLNSPKAIKETMEERQEISGFHGLFWAILLLLFGIERSIKKR